ncbi:MAG: hypothetical protein ACRELB_01715 [Polyangiaceae bacterium]
MAGARTNRRAWALAAPCAVVCAGLALSCASTSGRVHGESGPVPDWSLRPNRCKVGDPSPVWGGDRIVAVAPGVADLFYAGPDAADTEVVVRAEGDRPSLLVRIPGQGRMVVLRREDCSVLDVSMGHTAYTVNDEAGLVGHARFECSRPEIGRVTGDLSFTCF